MSKNNIAAPVRRGLNVRSATITLTTLAVLIAAEVVLNLLEIHTGTIKINLAFIPVVVAAYLYGSAGGIVIYGLGDIIGCIVHPVGAWYPPITLTYALIGGIFGLFLHRSRKIVPTVSAVVINQGIVSMLITSLWIALLMYKPDSGQFFAYYFTAIIPMRVVPMLIMAGIQIITIPLILKAIDRIGITDRLSPLIKTQNSPVKN